jgi:hypothetical protein
MMVVVVASSVISFVLEKKKNTGGGSTTLLVPFFNLLPFLPLCFFFFSPLSSLPVSFPLFFLCFFSFLPLSSVRFLLPLLRSLSQRSWVLFIEPRAWLFTVLMGSSRLVGHWARLPRFGSHRFSGRCVVGGRPVCSVGGLQAREGPAKFKQKLLFPSSPLHVRGKKKEEQYFGLHPP